MSQKRPNFCGRTRREFIWQTGGGFGAAALSSMLGQDGFFTEASGSDAVNLNPLAPKPPHFAPKAKSVIFLFMYGGPSHIDTFDRKPINERDGRQNGGGEDFRTRRSPQDRGPHRRTTLGFPSNMASAENGSALSFPTWPKHVDDIAFLHSMTADSPIHGSAMLMMNSGKILSGSPALGSWVNYGLGSVKMKICPASSSCWTHPVVRSAGQRTGAVVTCRPPIKGNVFRTEGAPISGSCQPPEATSALMACNANSSIPSRSANSTSFESDRPGNDDLGFADRQL